MHEGGEICTFLEKVESKQEKFSSKWFLFFYRIFSLHLIENLCITQVSEIEIPIQWSEIFLKIWYLETDTQVQSNHSFLPITNISVDNLIFLDHFTLSRVYCSPLEKTEVLDSCSSYRIFIKGSVKPNERKTIIVIHNHVSTEQTYLVVYFNMAFMRYQSYSSHSYSYEQK